MNSKFSGPHGWALNFRHWPKKGAVGTVVGVHGYSEHSGSYSHFAEFLNSRNFEVLWLDLPGHGLSEGKRSNIDDFNDYIVSLEMFLLEVEKLKCPKPFFLFGHSLGGLICIRFIQEAKRIDLFKCLVLSSPLLGLSNYSSKTLPFLRLLTWILPNFTISNDGELGGGVLTHDKAMIERRASDPLIKSVVTFHWTREFLKARAQAFDRVDKIRLPVGLFQAGVEKVTDRKEAERFFDLLSCPKYKKIYEGLYHEIVNEVERAQVMQDISEWMMKT